MRGPKERVEAAAVAYAKRFVKVNKAVSGLMAAPCHIMLAITESARANDLSAELIGLHHTLLSCARDSVRLARELLSLHGENFPALLDWSDRLAEVDLLLDAEELILGTAEKTQALVEASRRN